MTLRASLLALSVLGLASGCAGHEDKAGKAPVPVSTTPQPEPLPEATEPAVKVSVASVQLEDDCPAPAPAKPTASAKAAEPAMLQDQDIAPGSASGKHTGFAPTCIQSRVQLSIDSEAEVTQSFSIRAVRLKKAEGGDVLGTMTTREPALWADSKYTPWDESIAAGAAMKVGYALGDPDWGKVEKALGGSSWGPMYIVEIDIEVDGRMQTVSSPKVPRDEPLNVVT